MKTTITTKDFALLFLHLLARFICRSSSFTHDKIIFAVAVDQSETTIFLNPSSATAQQSITESQTPSLFMSSNPTTNVTLASTTPATSTSPGITNGHSTTSASVVGPAATFTSGTKKRPSGSTVYTSGDACIPFSQTLLQSNQSGEKFSIYTKLLITLITLITLTLSMIVG